MTNALGYINEENFPTFKKCYEKAVTDNEEVFFFEEHCVLTAFAKHVVEYFETQGGNKA